MRATLLKPLGISIAAVAIAAFAYGASAQEKKKEPAKKPPPACTKLKEADCKARSDCVFTAAVMNEKTKKVKTKASCKAVPKAPAAKKEPAKK